MIRIQQLKLPIAADSAQIEAALRKTLGLSPLHPLQWEIVRRSLDARRGHAFQYAYMIDAQVAKEDTVWKRLLTHSRGKAPRSLQRLAQVPSYTAPAMARSISRRPIVVGMGPAGLLCALLLARAGLQPLVIERGRPVEQRRIDTQAFFTAAQLNPESNVQFGEGGAGTFSDGKLNTLIKDKSLRGRFVLEEFVKAGAPESILYDAKPHVGTDRLQGVVRCLRQQIQELGGEIRFETRLVGLSSAGSQLTGAWLEHNGQRTLEEASALFLGIGHSARDTFAMLLEAGIHMEEKPFAMGLRIEHPQAMINQAQYREYATSPYLGAADYKLTHQASTGRGIYTFCMCPGGTVVAAASEPHTVVVNGMSNYARDEENANSALLVTVTPEDFASYRDTMGVLSGVGLQRDLEHRAFLLGGGHYGAPIQCVGDFLARRDAFSALGAVRPGFTGQTTPANLWDLLPDYMALSIAEGIQAFGQKLTGFDRPDAVLTGVESRSSSPVRIVRDETLQSNLRGLYPMGEGAGYAGGIMSAAIDGMKAAEAYLQLSTEE